VAKVHAQGVHMAIILHCLCIDVQGGEEVRLVGVWCFGEN
jgi:hypothetical protein